MGIARRAVPGVDGGETISELVHVERRDQHRACGVQAVDSVGVGLRGWRIGIEAGPCGRRQSAHIEQILDAIRHARQRPRITPRSDSGIDRSGLRPGAVGQDARYRDQSPALCRQSGKALLQYGHGAGLSRPDSRGDLDGLLHDFSVANSVSA